MRERLPEGSRKTVSKLVRAVVPPSRHFAPAGERTVGQLETVLDHFGGVRNYVRLLALLEHAPRATHFGRPFSRLSEPEAETFLTHWADGDLVRRSLAMALTIPVKVAYFDDPEVYRRLGCVWQFDGKPEAPPWKKRVMPGADLAADESVECDVVVVGTGAGGAVVAKELAERGHAVVLLEEGEYHGRESFDGRAIDGFKRFYRQGGLLASLGNAVIPIPTGRLVGGSTAINTGTCWRTPEWILDKWSREYGLTDLSATGLAPYFDRVERELQVETAPAQYLGGVARVIARGCDQLGWRHFPLRRNAPGCDGSGVCDFGCPTDARRSTNVSYVPAALKRGTLLWTGLRATELLFENGRVVGLRARARHTRKTLTVRARATVLSCGTLLTPLLLEQHRLGGAHVGRNLSIHPSTMVSALFEESIRGYAAIPQGYCCDQFQREGILLLGASAPIDIGSGQFSFVGQRLMRIMEAYDRVASFGVMVEDASRGRVRRGPGGRPLIFYWLGKKERKRLQRGVEIVARIFLAAGAREVYPALHGHRVIENERDLDRLRRAKPAAHDYLLTAFHPLGTCRMSARKGNGVVSPDHQVWDVPGLYIADGSVVPSSIAVNPQVTIMALATRAAERISAAIA